jgi:regulator of cell morphogenesis and NO signaling
MITNSEQTVRDIVVANPAAARVFENAGIDYCCGGRRSLASACEVAGVSLERVAEMLAKAAETVAPEDQAAWSEAPLSALTAHIVERHHDYIRTETPRLRMLLDKVISRHGAAHPELAAIRDLFTAVADELATHMLKEEQVLFPYLEKMDAAVRAQLPIPPAFFGTVERPIANMIADHEDAGELTAKIRELSRGFMPAEGTCPTYRALYQGLEDFERDLHRHVHLENNILFPRAIEMERRQDVGYATR